MTDSRNQPETETLSYKPHKDDRGYGLDLSPTSTLPPVMGFNAHVIKPEVNKAEGAEQPITSKEQAEKVAREYFTVDQPNKDIIEEIEGLMKQVNDKLLIMNITIPMSDKPESRLIAQALEDIDLFQKVTLPKLKEAFE